MLVSTNNSLLYNCQTYEILRIIRAHTYNDPETFVQQTATCNIQHFDTWQYLLCCSKCYLMFDFMVYSAKKINRSPKIRVRHIKVIEKCTNFYFGTEKLPPKF